MSAARRAVRTALLLAIALCAPGPAGADELVAAGAVSLRQPLVEIARGFEASRPGTRVRLTFGASSFLAAQLRAGAPIDVLVSADERIVEALVGEGLVPPDGHAAVASNGLVVMVRPGLAPVPGRAQELDAPEIRRIAMPDFAVPVGRYAREWLTRRGLLERLAPRIVATEHARATLAAVDAGHADAAIVYATDARLARDARLAFEVPAAEQPRIVYAAARAREAAPGARALLAWLTGSEARESLRRAGFGAP
jgi:molybdate transport system substrate-binding protein